MVPTTLTYGTSVYFPIHISFYWPASLSLSPTIKSALLGHGHFHKSFLVFLYLPADFYSSFAYLKCLFLCETFRDLCKQNQSNFILENTTWCIPLIMHFPHNSLSLSQYVNYKKAVSSTLSFQVFLPGMERHNADTLCPFIHSIRS